MTLRTGTWRRSNGARQRQGAFTLIELILVLALLSIVISITAPTLARFFRGRAIEEEGQRFVALTRYGQSRAVSEGVPIVLWMNPTDRKFGLRVLEGFTPGSGVGAATDNTSGGSSGVGKDVNFQLADRLRFALDGGGRAQNQEATIRFAPDGTISEDSLQRVEIRQDNGDSIAVVQSDNHSSYVIEQKTGDRALAAQ